MPDNPNPIDAVGQAAGPLNGEKPLQSWKEIAAYLDREPRTARRWEKTQGLPVRRHGDSSRASVYAYPSELDAWRAARKPKAAGEQPPRMQVRLAPLVAVAAMTLIATFVVLQGPILNPVDPLAEAAGTTVQLLFDDPEGDVGGTISADGRFLSCSHWATGNTGICDLAGGEKKVLTQYGDWSEDDAWKKSGFADANVISPDGKQIAFTYYTSGYEPNPTVELRIIGSDGTGGRTLYSKSPYSDDGWITPDAWSSDGKQILARIQLAGEGWRPPGRGNYAIVLVSVEDGSLRTLKELKSPRRYRRRTFLSRDSRYVAYDFPPDREVSAGDVFILPTAGGEAVSVAPHAADDYTLGWTPDGGTLIFASNRSGSYGIWAVTVRDGEPVGEPELVRPHVGEIVSAGFDRDGSFYYSLKSEPTNAYVATIDRETGKATGTPRRVTDRFSGSNDWAAWSPDGKRIAYRSWQGPSDKSGMKISIRSVAGSIARDIVPQLATFSRLRWHADGRSLLVVGRTSKARSPGLYQVDARSGETELLLEESSSEIADWTTDAREVILHHRKPSRLARKNLDDGSETEFYKLPEEHRGLHVSGLSPDDKTVAIARTRQPGGTWELAAIATETGEVRELFQFEKSFYGRHEGFFAWSPDSRAIYLVFRREGRIMRVPTEGGEPVDTGLIRGVWPDRVSEDEPLSRRIRAVSISPDGRRLSFSFQEKWEFGLWVMKDFLPKVTSAR